MSRGKGCRSHPRTAYPYQPSGTVRTCPVGSGERPLAVPKKFRFGKIAGNGSAVHRDKRLVPTVALFMQFAGDMLLSRTGGSPNEHGNVGTCHQPH